MSAKGRKFWDIVVKALIAALSAIAGAIGGANL